MRHPGAVAAAFIGALDATPSWSSQSATAPRRHTSIRSMTGIIDRQRKPAGTWLTIASRPLHLTGSPAAPVTIATVRPRAVYRQASPAQSSPLSDAPPAAGQASSPPPISAATNERSSLFSLLRGDEIVPVGRPRRKKAPAICNQQVWRPRQHHRREPRDYRDHTPAVPGTAPQAQPQPAERDQQQAFRRQSRHCPDIARQGRDVLRDPDRKIDPPAHRQQRQAFQT